MAQTAGHLRKGVLKKFPALKIILARLANVFQIIQSRQARRLGQRINIEGLPDFFPSRL